MARILVIDDSPTVREMVRATLESEGHEVVQAIDGRAGVEAQRRLGCDAVITDLIMPEQEGLQTIRELRRAWPELPIVAVSGGSAVLDKDDLLFAARTFGAARTLAKPFTARDLLHALGEAVAEPARSAPPPTRRRPRLRVLR